MAPSQSAQMMAPISRCGRRLHDHWWPFKFGCSADEIDKMKADDSYHPRQIYDQNPKIRRAVDTLRDRTFAINDAEHQVFSDLFHKLIEGHYGGKPDRYFCPARPGKLL